MAPATLRPARRTGGGPPVTCPETRADPFVGPLRRGVRPPGGASPGTGTRSGARSSSASPGPADAATTPRWSKSAARRAAAAVSVAAHHGQLAQQVDELLHVAHEVAGRELGPLQDTVEALPSAQRQAASANPSSGARVRGRCEALLLGAQPLAPRRRSAASRGEAPWAGDARRRARRPRRVSKVHDDTTAASSGGSSPSKSPSARASATRRSDSW